MIQAFIFDMDGVLIDSENLYKVIESQLFQQVGVSIDHAEHVSYQGCSNPVMWSNIKERHRLPHPIDELVRITEESVIQYFSSLPEIQPMPGVVDLLNWLKKKERKLALASSSSIEVIRIVLAKTHLEKYFDIIADCSEAGAGKPDPAIFLLAQKKLGIPRENCVIIEDSTNGIKAALAAGIYCIAFNGPGSEHQDQSAANLRVKEFSEIIEMLDREKK
ncbi:MAG: HAD family phosphatase [Prolixibacteraceae bacterium]